VATIVACEDDQDVRNLIVTCFRRSDHLLYPAADGIDGLALIEQHTPDLVLCDVHMPGLGGLELLDQLRAREDLASIPVLLLSASAQASEIEEGLRRGAVGYVTKPFTPTELREAVSRHLAASLDRAD
jgi:CheY-like chemotaxis protein